MENAEKNEATKNVVESLGRKGVTGPTKTMAPFDVRTPEKKRNWYKEDRGDKMRGQKTRAAKRRNQDTPLKKNGKIKQWKKQRKRGASQERKNILLVNGMPQDLGQMPAKGKVRKRPSKQRKLGGSIKKKDIQHKRGK